MGKDLSYHFVEIAVQYKEKKMENERINIEVVENGVICRHSWDEGAGESRQYKDETMVFPDLDTATEYLKEALGKGKKEGRKIEIESGTHDAKGHILSALGDI